MAWGESGGAYQDVDAALRYRAGLADASLRADDPLGSPGTRNAFTLMGARGASFMMTLSPVRFLQIMFAEAADWRVLAPDEAEPVSTRLAREMFEYRDAGSAWGLVGVKRDGGWDTNARMSWNSLHALAVALGITQTITPIDDDTEESLDFWDQETGARQP